MHTIMKYQPAGKQNPEWPLGRGWTFILSLQMATGHKSLKACNDDYDDGELM